MHDLAAETAALEPWHCLDPVKDCVAIDDGNTADRGKSVVQFEAGVGPHSVRVDENAVGCWGCFDVSCHEHFVVSRNLQIIGEAPVWRHLGGEDSEPDVDLARGMRDEPRELLCIGRGDNVLEAS